MIIEYLEIIEKKGAGNLLFKSKIQSWINILQANPEISKDDQAIDYNWNELGIYLSVYHDERRSLRIGHKQKKLTYKGIDFFEDDNDEVHRKMCELDGYPMYKLGYTYLFNLGICLIDFYNFKGGQDDRVVSVFTTGVYDKTGKRMRRLEESEW